MASSMDSTQQAQPSLVRKLVIVLLLPVLLIIAFLVIGRIIVKSNEKPEERRRPYTPLAVLAEIAVQDDVQLIVDTQGEARPRTEIDLVPQVGGKIIYVADKFVDGGIFAKNDLLYRIDPADFQVAVTRAEAAVARARQVLIREQAEADIARRDWEEIGTGEPSDLTLRKPQLAEARAGLQSAEADLENAKIQLNRTYVRAPFNGRVRTKISDIGQFVSPGTRLGRIFSTNIVEVRVPLTDDDLSKVNLPIAYVAPNRSEAPDVKIFATIAGQVQTWDAKLMRTDSTYDTQTRALFAIAEVFDPYGDGKSDNGVPLAPGLFVNVEILGKFYDDVIVLPRDGLRPENVVYVANEDGSADVITAKVLDTTMEYAYILEGVELGDIVILSPVEESRLPGPLKVYDISDTTTVLIDPPKPQWLIDKEAEEAKDASEDDEGTDSPSDEDDETTQDE